MASGCYNIFKGGLMSGQYSLAIDSTQVALMSTVHAFTATNTIYGNLTANELAQSGGYLTGGIKLTTLAIVNSGTSTWDAADVSWTSSSFVAGHAVIYDPTTGNCLVCSIDFGGSKEVASGTFTLQWNATGIITLA